MRVLYCHDNYYLPGKDGTVYSAGQFPYSYWEPFLNSFDELIVTGRAFPQEDSYKRHNISSGPNVSFRLFPNINSPVGLLKYRAGVSKDLESIVKEVDAVIIRAVSDIGWLAYLHARKMKKPIAMEMAACSWDSTWNHGNPLGKIYAPVRMLRDKAIAKNADFTVYVTNSFLQNRYPAGGKTEIVSNVRLKNINESTLDIRRQKINNQAASGDKIRIGLIGNLDNKIKGLSDALNALALVQKKLPNSFVFHQLGPGNTEPYKVQIESLGIEDLCFFDGMVPTGDKVFEWLDKIDIYIQPSYQEGLPRATIEAMSLACPIIASTAGGIPELIDNKWLMKPGDYNRLSELIISLINDKQAQLEQAEKNFDKSHKFQSDELKPRRNEFWKSFASFVKEKI
jgi:glycosyltransferase involved in cell wall biosynthesis